MMHPVLTRADVGVAMGTIGKDAAIEAADMAIMGDDLRKLPAAIQISRKVSRIVKQNISIALIYQDWRTHFERNRMVEHDIGDFCRCGCHDIGDYQCRCGRYKIKLPQLED